MTTTDIEFIKLIQQLPACSVATEVFSLVIALNNLTTTPCKLTANNKQWKESIPALVKCSLMLGDETSRRGHWQGLSYKRATIEKWNSYLKTGALGDCPIAGYLFADIPEWYLTDITEKVCILR